MVAPVYRLDRACRYSSNQNKPVKVITKFLLASSHNRVEQADVLHTKSTWRSSECEASVLCVLFSPTPSFPFPQVSSRGVSGLCWDTGALQRRTRVCWAVDVPTATLWSADLSCGNAFKIKLNGSIRMLDRKDSVISGFLLGNMIREVPQPLLTPECEWHDWGQSLLAWKAQRI